MFVLFVRLLFVEIECKNREVTVVVECNSTIFVVDFVEICGTLKNYFMGTSIVNVSSYQCSRVLTLLALLRGRHLHLVMMMMVSRVIRLVQARWR